MAGSIRPRSCVLLPFRSTFGFASVAAKTKRERILSIACDIKYRLVDHWSDFDRLRSDRERPHRRKDEIDLPPPQGAANELVQSQRRQRGFPPRPGRRG